MFHNLKLKDFIQLLVVILIAVIGGYYYVNTIARNKLWLKTYPLRAKLSNQQLTCSPNAPTWLADIIKNQTTYGNAPSNQIAFIDKNNQIHHCENGYIGQYPLLSDPVTQTTRFRYASVTKLWTSDATLELIKQNKLSFDTPITQILTEVNNPKDLRINQITVGQLLLHRGGFDRYTVFGGNDMFGIGEEICPNHLDNLNKIQLNFSPNEKMSYSNLGYCLLGEIISRVNKQPYVQIIQQQYHLTPTTIDFVENKPAIDEVFYNYVETDITGFGDVYSAFDFKGLASAAGLSGNAINLAQQAKMMMKKPSPNILTIPNTPCDLSKWQDCYGYATYAYQQSPLHKKVYYRDGRLLGLNTLLAMTEQGEVVAILSNGNPLGSQYQQNLVTQVYRILNH
ncbi:MULTISPECIES: serine hydrolase domain-containing protein [unclassified Moraxella]|uniref:serine hydrolase domain-containing protein n=1 Tax=unclassified Moraxella TaxID=2685852 RepID=UPI003AF6FB60